MNIQEEIDKILISYNHYHDIMADDIANLIAIKEESAYKKGYEQGKLDAEMDKL